VVEAPDACDDAPAVETAAAVAEAEDSVVEVAEEVEEPLLDERGRF
jgi:hypothetical protein